MALEPILSSTDNLYKFLFILGASMIAFAVLSPMEKRNEIQIAIIEGNSREKAIQFEAQLISEKVDRINLNESSTSQLDSLEKELNELELLHIEEETEIERVKALKDQLEPYKKLSSWLIGVGIFLLVFGFFNWIFITIQQEWQSNIGLWACLFKKKDN